MKEPIIIRNATSEEFEVIGKLMVSVYSQLHGFPKPEEQPNYYDKLLNVGKLTEKESTELLVAVNASGVVEGAVVYFSDMKDYGSGGTATTLTHASGFRLLAVSPQARGKGIGRLLCEACIKKTKQHHNKSLVIHSTKAMQIAWNLYERMGFKRFHEIDFLQDDLEVFGFKLHID